MNNHADKSAGAKEWLSVYLFLESGLYDARCDEFLVQIVAPLMMEYLHNAWIDQFFFIRYAENGPHVRLRLYGNADMLRTVVKPALTDRLTILRGRTPGVRDIQWVAYEPEMERYGGPHALPVAEEFFCQSSAIVCRWLPSLDDTNRSRRLGRGLLAMVSLAHATTSDRATAVAFLDKYGQSYPRRLASDADTKQPWMAAMDSRYAAQSTQIAQFVSQAWMQLESGDEIDGIIGEYANAVLETMRKLRDLHAIGRVTAWNSTVHDWPASARFIGTSLMHMTNNRLGISIDEEVYLSSLAARALRAEDSSRVEFV